MKLQFILSLFTIAPRLSLQLLSGDVSVPESQAISSVTFADRPLELLARQQPQTAPGKKKDSCKACPRRKCSSIAYFRNAATCRCEKCPNGQKAKQRGDGCEKTQDDKKKNKNDKSVNRSPRITGALLTSYDRIKDTIERKKKEYQQKKRQKTKKEMVDKVKDKKRTEYKRNKKRTRMGKCLLLVPLSIYGEFDGIAPLSSYAEDFFSEDFVTGDAIDEFWPGDFGDAPDVDIDSDEYTASYVEIAAAIEDDKDTRWKDPIVPIGLKREEPSRVSVPKELVGELRRTEASDETTADIQATYHQLNKRNPVAAVLRAILAFVGRFASATRTVVGRFATIGQRTSARLKDLAARGGARLAKSGGKKTLDEMKNAARTIYKNKNWKNCLNGVKPSRTAA
ncbi:hypothetical protein COL26b_007748 [Colletotrichum chrysophilum]|uniref:uncharacterized protein n=1 Tax=Colletotrichum chrysophilum TaxID=1836956 RepID=UPI002300F5EF|nr:uncharacterized protein COL26b_007748 [Colletotrichum chrysophilum]KAJ0374037.1 hypothetical protein COL26b_007748 [Colletotrichum chrysophilum]